MNKCLRYFLFVANSEISGFEVFCIFLQAFIANSMHLVKNHCIWKDIVFLISYLILISSRYLVVSLMWLYQPPIIKLQKQFENCKLFALMMKTWQSLLYSNTMFVCMCVCLRPISSRTARPIWLNFFLLASSWSHDGFRPKKIPDSGSGFSGNPEKPRILTILKILVLFAIVTKSITTQTRMDFLQFFLRLWSPNMPIAHLFWYMCQVPSSTLSASKWHFKSIYVCVSLYYSTIAISYTIVIPYYTAN